MKEMKKKNLLLQTKKTKNKREKNQLKKTKQRNF